MVAKEWGWNGFPVQASDTYVKQTNLSLAPLSLYHSRAIPPSVILTEFCTPAALLTPALLFFTILIHLSIYLTHLLSI